MNPQWNGSHFRESYQLLSVPSPAPLSEQFQLYFLRLPVNEWAKWIFHQFLCESYFLCVSKALNWVETSPKKRVSQVQSFFTNNSSPQIINYAFETCFLTVIVPFSLLQLLLLFCFHYLLFSFRTTSEMALSSSCFVRGADKYTLLALANSANTQWKWKMKMIKREHDFSTVFHHHLTRHYCELLCI